MNVSFRFFECQLCGAISAVHVALAEEQEVECPSCGVALEGEDWLCDKDVEFPTEREKTLDPPAATTCIKQTFGAEIKRLQREVEGLTKTRELQEAEIQRLKAQLKAAEKVVELADTVVSAWENNGSPLPEDRSNLTVEISDYHSQYKCGCTTKEG